MTIFLGCIADDFTGATDLANNLVRAGLRVVQTIGVPAAPLGFEVDAIVVALKSRTVSPRQAVAESLAALRWLQTQGAQQFYFKVCSTFDSTPQGNIGPVTEALMDALACNFCVVTPAFPDAGRAVFKGHLFVGDSLLSDSSMRQHPLTPMIDSNLVRVMQAQSQRRVGLIDFAVIAHGPDAIRERITHLQKEGVTLAIADALSNDDLLRLGAAVKGEKLVTAGSGLAIGLPQNFGIRPSAAAARLPPAKGLKAVISGSCSQATNRQVAASKAAGLASLALDPLRLAGSADAAVHDTLAWAKAQFEIAASDPVLIYSSADAAQVAQVQAQLGAFEAGELVEATLARIAQGLVAMGVGQLIVAGGETSGACVQALGVTALLIGPQIDAGVPWCHAERSDLAPPYPKGSGLHLALKSGNFGGDDFFARAFIVLLEQP
jgi:3-dehydrotetronate 4-kinase